ncbi:MAG: NAD-dependent epimerase/dehydratase family protein [Minicystis sp.]
MTTAHEGTSALVTGGSGYVGGWMIVGLLARGYRVRATLRDLAKGDALRAAVGRWVDPGDRLSFVAADLRRDEGWARAAEGCSYVVHVASPMGQGDIKGKDLLAPARDGTLRVLTAAREAGVQRVVVTSSVVAAQPPGIGGEELHGTADESHWTDLTAKETSDYARSKTLAERAAWDFMAQAGAGTTLTTILPVMILGPVLSKEVSGSVEIVSRMLSGRLPALPRIGFGVVDVRDLVDLHLAAMVAPEAAGQRLVACSGFLWMAEIAEILRRHLGPRASRVPTRRLPDWVLRLAALFQEEARFMAPLLGRRVEYKSDKAAALLGFRPRSPSETVTDCADSLLALGAV